jgi:hypothetical protein
MPNSCIIVFQSLTPVGIDRQLPDGCGAETTCPEFVLLGAASNLGKRLFFTGHGSASSPQRLDTLCTRCPVLALAECPKGVSRRAIGKMPKFKAAPVLFHFLFVFTATRSFPVFVILTGFLHPGQRISIEPPGPGTRHPIRYSFGFFGPRIKPKTSSAVQ